MKIPDVPQLLFRWQRADILGRVLLQYHDKRAEHFVTFERLNNAQTYAGQVNTFATGYMVCIARPSGPAVWVGYCNDDPRTSIERNRTIETHVRVVLKKLFSRDKWVIPEQIKDSIGWSFAMYRETDGQTWHDATGHDPKCRRVKYLDAIIEFAGSDDETASWIVEQMGVSSSIRSSILALLRGQTLTPNDICALAVACTPAEVEQLLKDYDYPILGAPTRVKKSTKKKRS